MICRRCFPNPRSSRSSRPWSSNAKERLDRIALLDPPVAAARDDALGVGAVRAWRSRFDSKYAALYFPWLCVMDPLRLGGLHHPRLPPSGHVAGLFARTDLQTGVHKAPANLELQWAEDTTVRGRRLRCRLG